MAIVWTKYWAGSDDGTILKGIDLRNIQDDLAVVQTVDDVLSIPSQTQGDILYFNGSIWTRLPNGTDGQSLLTQGPSMNPMWGYPADLDISGAADGDLLYYDGSNWVPKTPAEAGAGTRATFYTSSDTFTAPAGVTNVYITMIGGGGGGAPSGATGSGGGGGGGEFVINYPYTVTPLSDYTVTIGAGGTSGVSGVDTSFDSLTVEGGDTGVTGDGNGGAGGGSDGTTKAGYDASASVSTVASSGADGMFRGGNGAKSGGGGTGGGGAGSPWGEGGNGRNVNTGLPGTGYGSGGGGGGDNGPVKAGGAGSGGFCLVIY